MIDTKVIFKDTTSQRQQDMFEIKPDFYYSKNKL